MYVDPNIAYFDCFGVVGRIAASRQEACLRDGARARSFWTENVVGTGIAGNIIDQLDRVPSAEIV